MSPLTLTTTQQTLLQQASRSVVEDYFVSLPQAFRSQKWLLKKNRYRKNCALSYTDEIKTGSSHDHTYLTAYVSASALTQVIDGWSYLGRAVDATLRGDSYAAIHLGYYAELRAAMGLLASEGIGILGRHHLIVKGLGSTDVFSTGKGTHVDIWPMLNYWSTLPRAANLIDDLVRPSSIGLSNWLSIGPTPTIPVGAVAQDWLKSWGLDLANVDDDHDCRNIVSYRPSEFRRPKYLNVHQQTAFVEELWQLFEPGTTQRFPNIARLLVRNARRDQTKKAPSVTDLQRLGLTKYEALEWITFLQQKRADDPMPFQLVKKRVPIEDPTCHLRIISRAALMLFIASASARHLLTNAGYSLRDIFFWWGQHGEGRALWDIGSLQGDPRDIWADIEQAINDSVSWRAYNPIGNASLRQWRHSQTSALADFGGFELVGIWALMP